MNTWRGWVCVILLAACLALPGNAAAGSLTSAASPAPGYPSAGDYSPSDAGGVRYTVKRGDTLNSIGARYGVSALAIARANGIKDPDYVQAGTVLTIPAAGSSSSKPAPKPVPAPSGSGYRFVASISQQHCWLFYGKTVKYSWSCSTGRSGSPTIPGNYKIRTKMGKAWGATWGFWMPYWLGIYMVGKMENGIHGLPYYPVSGKTIWGPSIGTPVSYGCVVMDNEAMAQLYKVAYVGMPVTILR